MLAPLNFFLILSVLLLQVLEVVSNRAILSHFIFGNVYSYTEKNWEETFDLASRSGIHAFAFNIALDSWTDDHLKVAFRVAEKYHTKICFSFDLAVATWNNHLVIETLKRYVELPGHFKWEGNIGQGKYLVSTFDGNAGHVDWDVVKAAVPNLYVVPHLSPDQVKAKPKGIDGCLNWNCWATANNQPINGTSSTIDDHIMQTALGEGKAYATLVSPWSFTNYHAGINKQWIFKSDCLLETRWNQMLTFDKSSDDAHIDLIELYSWNDYGESNYMNDISTALDNEFSGGADEWCKGFKHDGWRLLNIPFINAFMAHDPAVTPEHIDTELVVFHHRPYPGRTLCTGQTTQIPGAEFVPDEVTIISALHKDTTLVITSGDKKTSANVGPGITTTVVEMQLGTQCVEVMRNNKTCGEVKSAVEVKNSCSVINYNANVEYIIVKC